MENTHNRGGGSIYPIGNIERISTWARKNKLIMHLDGARLMNAVVATGIPADRWARNFDSISMCFSKGLGAPVGSVLAGTSDFIREAKRIRKRFGGGMRQAGFLASACLYALDHNVQRLAEDHAHAQFLAQAFEECGFGIRADEVDTNILWIDIDPEWSNAKVVQERFARRGILILALDTYVIRAVTHLGITRDDVEAVAAAARDVVHELR
ncbi:MAG: beta-eliminating lyase-related protein [Planctomycetota bacterium]